MSDAEKLMRAASYAAQKHRSQRRKGADADPYINHPLQVAALLAEVGKVTDTDILIAALLHDVVEDTDTTPEELEKVFGSRAVGFVMEVTDDKDLTKAERKRRQVEHAPHLSPEAKQIKIADKYSNISDIINNPPHNWSDEQRAEYIKWGQQVFAGLRGVNENLDKAFEELIARSKSWDRF
jgi:GTP diphosphokinase / guanosine-3',5'-bis(diphosphate) 3'-diphosphatase